MKLSKIRKDDKVVYCLGSVKLFSRKSKSFVSLESRLSFLERKVSMIDNVWRNDDVLFYVPNYPYDFVQRAVVNREDYFERDILDSLQRYIPSEAVILDIGANIGNHSLYFCKKCKAKRIIAFEPVKETYAILKRNIELNGLDGIITACNFGLSNENMSAEIKKYTMSNIGATSIEKKADGTLRVMRLDDYDFSQIQQIDFMKIDVEGHEILALEGAKETIKKYSPVIFIETFDNNKDTVHAMLAELGYACIQEYKDSNYLFKKL